jgi:hypothetical protein
MWYTVLGATTYVDGPEAHTWGHLLGHCAGNFSVLKDYLWRNGNPEDWTNTLSVTVIEQFPALLAPTALRARACASVIHSLLTHSVEASLHWILSWGPLNHGGTQLYSSLKDQLVLAEFCSSCL